METFSQKHKNIETVPAVLIKSQTQISDYEQKKLQKFDTSSI